MRHDWIFDVLKDLQTYALRHDLPALAAQAGLALRVARAEIAASMDGQLRDDRSADGPDDRTGDAPPGLQQPDDPDGDAPADPAPPRRH